MLHCFDAHQLIGTAYNPLANQDRQNTSVIGGPAWINSIRYDVEAKADGATRPEMMGILLLNLMKERFHLQTHTEPRDTPVYLLTVGARGPKLKPADRKACVARDTFQIARPPTATRVNYCGTSQLYGRGGTTRYIDSYSVTMESLAAVVAEMAGRRVVDRTGMQGLYDVHLEFTRTDTGSGPVTLNGEPAEPPGAELGAPSIFTAIQSQLGLKLTAATVPVDVIVIDRIDQPTEN